MKENLIISIMKHSLIRHQPDAVDALVLSVSPKKEIV